MADEGDGLAPPEQPTGSAKTCANCRARLDTEEWHPVVTRTDETGELRLYTFCDEECEAEWEAVRS